MSPASASPPLTHPKQLLELFERAQKPASAWRIGVESEKFGVREGSAEPLAYEGDFGVLKIFDWLVAQRGYRPESELPGGPTIAVRKGAVSITLEPGAQLELSAPAVETVHSIESMLHEHLVEIAPISAELGVKWLSLGFHPFAEQRELPWVPKQRYAIMREYLPRHGSGALDMMRRTATVQGNFDYSDSTDALSKLVVSLKMAPLVNAWLANSPYAEGKATGLWSNRGAVWLNMEPARSGLLGQLWTLANPAYDDYVEWALSAPMFLIKRDGRIIDNSGQTFRDFLANGFEEERATEQDWALHVNSLFPEARLKSTLELRSVDSLNPALAAAAIALFTGILYDKTALADAALLFESISYEQAEQSRPELVKRGLSAHYGPRVGFALAGELLSLARQGLTRRARCVEGQDETRVLAPLEGLLESQTSPASQLLEALGPEPDRRDLVALLGQSR